MKLHPTLPEYPPEWDEPDFEDLYRSVIDRIATMIEMSRFDEIALEFQSVLEDSFVADDFGEWIQEKRDDTQQTIYFDPRAKLNAPEVAWTYVEEMADRYEARR